MPERSHEPETTITPGGNDERQLPHGEERLHCGATHHTGCECHEAQWRERLAEAQHANTEWARECDRLRRIIESMGGKA